MAFNSNVAPKKKPKKPASSPWVCRPDAYKDHWKSQWLWQGTGERAKAFVLQPGFFDHLGSRRRGRILEILALQDANPDHIRRIADDPETGERRYARCGQGAVRP